jgi:hypothetical protein
MAKGILSALAAGAALLLTVPQRGGAQTFPASDRPAGYVVYAKIVVDTADVFAQGRRQDTLIQLTNLAPDQGGGLDDGTRIVECWYVDATSRCDNSVNQVCRTNADCTTGGHCVPNWTAPNFTIKVTTNQPVGWLASTGLDLTTLDAGSDGRVQGVGPYFIGELKCLEVNGASIVETTTTPRLANDLKGEATIYDVSTGAAGSVDARSYNAIGFQALDGLNTPTTGSDQTLCLGASSGSTACGVAEYASCPSILIVDHFFDGAADPVTAAGDPISTNVTLVPCSENLSGGSGLNTQTPTTAQFLVFNEFEQRFSTSTQVTCFAETQLSHIDTVPGNEASSIFNFAVQGTLTGQTRIRPVLSSDPNTGNGLLAVAEEFHGSHSAAFNVDYFGTNGGKGDFVQFDVSTGGP